METTAKYLRFHAKELLAAAERGEEVIITYRGKARAKLVGLAVGGDKKSKDVRRNAAFGLWRDLKGDVGAEIDRLRRDREF